MLFFLFYILSITILLIPILKIINYNILDESILFFLITNYILNISVALFFGYFSNFFLSLIAISFLLIFSILLIKDFKRIFGAYQLSSVPYLLMVSFSFVYILITFLQSI